MAVVAGIVAVAVLLVAGIAVLALGRNGAGTATPRPSLVAAASASPGAPAVSGSPGGSGPPTTAPGGKLAEALVAAFQHDPFTAHVEESILASSTTAGARITVTAKAVGDVAGRDVAIRTTGTGNGPATDEQIVTVGDVAWLRPTDTGSWEVHPRSLVAPSVDVLLSTIRPLDDPATLVDVGIEDIDGTKLHHLTAVGAIAYHSLNGTDGVYNTFDVWATDAGTPVLVRATFFETHGVDSLTGSTEIRYGKIGGPIAITPPSGAPTLSP